MIGRTNISGGDRIVLKGAYVTGGSKPTNPVRISYTGKGLITYVNGMGSEGRTVTLIVDGVAVAGLGVPYSAELLMIPFTTGFSLQTSSTDPMYVCFNAESNDMLKAVPRIISYGYAAPTPASDPLRLDVTGKGIIYRAEILTKIVIDGVALVDSTHSWRPSNLRFLRFKNGFQVYHPTNTSVTYLIE